MHSGQKVLILLILVMSVSAWALTPSIDEQDWVRQADLVVKGEITDVHCAPNAFEQNACATATRYVATLRVNTVKKGRWPGRTVPIIFRDVRFLKGCVGDSDHTHLVGERGFYYLISRGDGNWALINRSAVFVRHPGTGPLPACSH